MSPKFFCSIFKCSAGRASPITTPLQRSNSAVDATAARRALVRQQYSESCRSKVQRSGSIRVGSGRSSGQEGVGRRLSGGGTCSQPESRSTSPTPTRCYQTYKNQATLDLRYTKTVSPVKKPEKNNVRESTSDIKLSRSDYETKNEYSGPSTVKKVECDDYPIKQEQKRMDKTQKDNPVPPPHKSNAVEEWVKNQNKYLTKAENSYVDTNDDQAETKSSNSTDDFSLCANSSSSHIRSMLKTLEEAIGKNDSEKQLEILDTVEEILADNIIISSAPDLAKLLLSKLIRLSRRGEKEVSRAAEECSINLVMSLPCTLSIPLLNTMVKKEQFPHMLTAIKLLDKVLEVQMANQVQIHLNEIMLGLLKSYDNVESSVRKASVNCMVTLHGLVGESALQPHLTCLSVPKRKLLSLYIMRHRQKMASSVK